MLNRSGSRSRPALSSDAYLANVVEEIAARLHAGEAVDLDAYVREFPEFAAQLQELLPALKLMANLSRSVAQQSAVSGEQSALGTSDAGQLGDFRLIREVGRGGMGVVYEAEQVSLGRRVALKLLPFAAALDSKQLLRFQNEARAAAQLHHTNIVPVYFVGTERGVHFYAMQFIDGHSLAEVIAGLKVEEDNRGGRGVTQSNEEISSSAPLRELRGSSSTAIAALSTLRSTKPADFFRKVAELGIQAAEALDHAHQLGVVHRDIKPANLLLDADARLWVADFGLAQFQAGPNLTLTGDLLGTLRYMSPEQALAKRAVLDHRTDIYSLGVTLYELLTLEPAMGGKDRAEILGQIASEDPKPLRRINGAIPPEIEIIISKMIEKDPASRYATAKDAADDLRRFLLHESIKARRPTLVQRARKWGRRHPAVMAAAAIGLVLVVIALAGIALLTYQHNQELNESNQALEAAVLAESQSKTVAERAKKTAEKREAATNMVLSFVEERILAAARPQGQEGGLGYDVTLRKAIESALPHLDSSFKHQPLIEARLRRTMGLSFRYLGDEKTAAEQFEAARKLYLLHAGPSHPDTLAVTNNLANSYAVLGRLEESLKLREETLELRKAQLGPDHEQTLDSMSNLAVSYTAAGRHEDALRLHEETLARRKAKFGVNHRHTLASMNNLGISYTMLGRHAEAAKLREETLPLMKACFGADHPNVMACMHNLAQSYAAMSRYPDALKLYDETLALAKQKLTDQHPNTLLVMDNIAWLLATAEDAHFRDPARAVELAEKAARLSPNNAEFWGTVGAAHYRAGHYKQAVADLEKAIGLRGVDDPQCANEAFFLAMAYWQLGDYPEAKKWFDKGVAWMDKGKFRDDEVRRFRAEAAGLMEPKDSP